ncbi:MAG: hypothetical protein EXR35_06875 [Limnohabitans sp.]|nr:hypothetical protein [Limnohabitans sp.]
MEQKIPLHRSVAFIGIGHSDWRQDWNRVRQGEVPFDSYGYATVAFQRALQDAKRFCRNKDSQFFRDAIGSVWHKENTLLVVGKILQNSLLRQNLI